EGAVDDLDESRRQVAPMRPKGSRFFLKDALEHLPRRSAHGMDVPAAEEVVQGRGGRVLVGARLRLAEGEDLLRRDEWRRAADATHHRQPTQGRPLVDARQAEVR